MSGYAVRKDGLGFRAVDGPEFNVGNESKVFPDVETEIYSETLPSLAQLSADVMLSQAQAKVSELLGVAALRIAPLQDAVDLGLATDSEVESLNVWKLYRVNVLRVVDLAGYPQSIEWPVLPDI